VGQFGILHADWQYWQSAQTAADRHVLPKRNYKSCGLCWPPTLRQWQAAT
jgi:hypothetical protein